MLKYAFQYIIYQFHILFILVTMCGWNFYPKTGILMPLVGLSWELNDNQCLITQLEKYLFDHAIIPGRIPIISKIFLYIDMILFWYHKVI